MSGKITTHVLNTAEGCPGAGIKIELYRGHECIATLTTNADGRTDRPLLAKEAMVAGEYELHFQLGPYFAQRPLTTSTPPYLDTVPIRVGISDPAAHYHVALLATPWGYTTYRGS